MARPAKTVEVDAATREAQGKASNPKASAWVSANAGSGKTYVLAERVVRLLLAGTDPGRILCLTFTRAAAGEMANRVFARLAEWTALSDAALARKIAAIEGRRPDAGELAEARRLFARALETPGGLKIQTIHAFCERLLHQFPFEGNVPGHFEVLDERDAFALKDQARRSVLARAAAEPEAPLGRALATVLASASDFVTELGINEFVTRRDRLRTWIREANSIDAALRELRVALGVAPGETADALRAAILDECDIVEHLEALVGELLKGGKNDRDAAGRLGPAVSAETGDERVEAYLDFWMTSQGDLRVAGSIVSRAVKTAMPFLDTWLEGERARLEALLDRLAAADCYETTAAMIRLADAAIGEYERAKTVRGVLDFEDLIARTAALLTRIDASRWVHYKLDRGIEHILVDEAQDTSPRQWAVVEALAGEFFAGEGASGKTRTIFAVGDEKQSIFSFQGAVPAWFAAMRGRFGERARAAGLAWAEPELHLSFRSVPLVLDAVDAVFREAHVHRGLASDAGPTLHTASRMNQPGRVIIWPMIEQPEKPEAEDWTTPLDRLGDKSPEVQLADRIARTIKDWLNRAEAIEATGELVRPGSILILSRIRGAQTDAINRALKSRGIAIAGADRLTLTDHIAVMDLMALGRVALLPEDDLSLAALLKSPLIGLNEDDLFEIAHARGKETLWRALSVAANTPGRFHAAWKQISDWRARADKADPHAFYARVLGAERGREKFLARLGSEVEDILDEFLAEALRFEEANTPSLEGFLAWLEAAETEVRRDTDSLRNEVRVMTVHGAKGLEADIVFLVDTGAAPTHAGHDPRVLSIGDDRFGRQPPLVWMRRQKAMPEVVKARVRAIREDAADEYRRLLYVGMTRARDRLYVCGTEKQISDKDRVARWHNIITAALSPEATRIVADDGTLQALEWRADDTRVAATKAKQEDLILSPGRPDWLGRDAPAAPPAIRRVTPSTAAGGEAVPNRFVLRGLAGRGDSEANFAIERGRLIHRLLESLPEVTPGQRLFAGTRYLASAGAAWNESERAALLTEVLAILDHRDFAPVFAPGSRAEVEIVGKVGEGLLSGRIDRLAVTQDRVLIVDYKTNRPAPESLGAVPQEYVMQLALYRLAILKLYPGRAVAGAILWTDLPSLMEIPSNLLEDAARIASGAAGGSMS